MALFDKTCMFTDIHFGLRGNSIKHNQTCINFIKWLIQECKQRDIKTCMFLGDYFHNRSTINVDTMNYGIQGLSLLNEYFDNVYFLVGNHDMYHRNKRDVTSVKFAQTFPNVHLIQHIEQIDDCLFLPFLVGDEWKEIEKYNVKYVFGHLELPGYKLNSLIEMPDHGKESDETFSRCEYVFSGHFHKRQRKQLQSGTQIHYIGNPFCHNFNDAWDEARGCVMLDHGKVPEYLNWADGPKYRTANMSDLLEDPLVYLAEEVTLKVNLDIDLTAEEIIFIRETYSKYFKLAEFKTVSNRKNDAAIEMDTGVQVESVDQVVLDQIKNLDSDTLDKNLLIEIYENL